MFKQLDIFSFIEDPGAGADFKEMSTEEIANYIGERVGLKFAYNARFNEFECRVNKIRFAVSKSSYTTYEREGEPFIDCDVQKTFGDYHGAGIPADSLEEAVEFFNHWISKFLGGVNA